MASNANIEDTHDALNSPQPRRRPLRSPKPSAKVRETLIPLENKAKPTKNTSSAATRPDGAPALDGRSSVAQRLLAEASNTRQNIEELKIVIQQQTDMLAKLSTELVSVKTELATVKAELSNVKNCVAEEQKQVAEELKQVYVQLDDISNNLILTTTTILDEPKPVVDNVNRSVVLDDEGNIRTGAAEAFSQENETTVAKIAWLSRKDTAKAYGSMVVYVTKGSDARRLLSEGFFHAGGESGYTRVFERRVRPEQCYNCQEIGHKAFNCKKAHRCAQNVPSKATTTAGARKRS
ncbi:predicted protein [Chaetomium globosum CBS 148.51]|uniref:CCHC-type domain-containing protein n=1 Tax=Chaetomium globosum (strain ATCC 6205 / CBS 148.51 / DSM 1962 / NBRC 6347 / NRRL 1970) TaxID=306901 RepID=Q2HCC5_CHAGB|nr:uncharacterized protein CHGG_02129 [Chaetomium globosum CBS 148.51]EAQ93894.1 predicted protein [Chaetomium globosum CBS 148.51]